MDKEDIIFGAYVLCAVILVVFSGWHTSKMFWCTCGI